MMEQVNDLKDLAKVLNRIKVKETNSEDELFTVPMLKKLSNPNLSSSTRYKVFEIKKKSGGTRTISAPCGSLRNILFYVNEMLAELYTPGPSAMGFVRGRSIVDNARVHIGHNYVYNLDLKDFFPSISERRVQSRLQLAPFNFPENVAKVVAGLCSIRIEEGDIVRYALPQGAPTSPLLSNAVCERLDKKLRALARNYGLHYTRYADDITFSSMHNVYQEDSSFISSLFDIIRDQRFTVNEKKTRLQKRGSRQEVTGLTVNDKINTTHKYVRELRNILYMWEKYGYDDTYARFNRYYKQEKGHIKKGEPILENVIEGKLNFLSMVKGSSDPVYLRFKSRFEALAPNAYSAANNQIVFVNCYSVPEFERVFETKVKLIKNESENLTAVFKMKGHKDKHLVSISKIAKELILSEKGKIRKNYSFEVPSLAKCYISLCRKDGCNFWILTEEKPSKHIEPNPRFNCVPIDALLDEWEENGLDSAQKLYEKFLNEKGLNIKPKAKEKPSKKNTGEAMSYFDMAEWDDLDIEDIALSEEEEKIMGERLFKLISKQNKENE